MHLDEVRILQPSILALPSRANHLFFHSAPISSSSKTLPTPPGSTTAPMSLRLHRLEATPTQTSTALAQRPLRHLLPLPPRPLPLPSSRPPALNRPSRLEGSELRLFSLPLLLSRCLKKSRTLATLEGLHWCALSIPRHSLLCPKILLFPCPFYVLCLPFFPLVPELWRKQEKKKHSRIARPRYLSVQIMPFVFHDRASHYDLDLPTSVLAFK